MPKPEKHQLEGFDDIVRRDEPLAPYTYLKVGGPAEWLIQPHSREELSAVVKRCFDLRMGMHRQRASQENEGESETDHATS